MLSLAYSPCPNDTFIFHALVHGLITPCLEFAPPVLADVETLNQWAMAKRFAVSKVSFHAFGLLQDSYQLLQAGSALGRGCGPLLVCRQDQPEKGLATGSVAIPGAYTTAALLLKLYAPHKLKLRIMPFEQIMPAVAAGQVDYGVIIHESRFTYQQHGLVAIADLGAWWEESSGLPIPLGGIVAQKSLGASVIATIDEAIRLSVEYAFAQPEQSRQYIKCHAQEMADQVIGDHIGLYVNSFSLALGEEGQAAVDYLLAKGKEAGIF